MELAGPVRMLVLGLGALGLMLLGTGLGGVSAVAKDSTLVTVVKGTVGIDTLLGPQPEAAGPGYPVWRRLRLSNATFGGLLRYTRRRVSRATIHHFNSIGIKAGFVSALVGVGTSTLILLSFFDLIFQECPRLMLLEKVLLGVGFVVYLSAGVLGCVWGRFVHLSEEALEAAALDSVFCSGWFLGGVSCIMAFLLTAMDFVLSVMADGRSGRVMGAETEPVKQVRMDGFWAEEATQSTQPTPPDGEAKSISVLNSLEWKAPGSKRDEAAKERSAARSAQLSQGASRRGQKKKAKRKREDEEEAKNVETMEEARSAPLSQLKTPNECSPSAAPKSIPI